MRINWVFFDPMLVTLWVVGIASVALLVLSVILAFYDIKHPCVAEGPAYYHSPTYVMVGKVMTPVGGGYYGDCIRRSP